MPMVYWIILVLADVMMGFRISKSGSGDKRRHRHKHDKRSHRPSSLFAPTAATIQALALSILSPGPAGRGFSFLDRLVEVFLCPAVI